MLVVTGREVRTPQPAVADAGAAATWSWDGRASDGHRVPPGVYLMRVRSGSEFRVARVLRVE